MTARSFAVARPVAVDVTARVKDAVDRFRQLRDALPVALAVHPSQVDAVTAACAELKLVLPVEAHGGVLVDEVWMELWRTV